MMKIVALHADAAQADLVRQVLTAAGHQCEVFKNDKKMLDHLVREPCDLLVIDWAMRESGGIQVLRWLNDNLSPRPPVLILTSGSEQEHIIAGLDAEADDYLVKPIRKGELAARVQVLLRRAYPNRGTTEQIRFGQYVFESQSGRLTMEGAHIEVTQKEFELALLFFRNLGRPLSRATILEAVWANDFDGSSRTMDTHVSRLRNKLQLRPERGLRLVPVYSYGYRLEQVPEQVRA